MGIAIRVRETGSSDVLKAESIPEAQPGPDEVWIEQEAIGVNYLDVTQRNGAVPIPLPSGLGVEAAGRVAAIGSNVANVAVGERVAYILRPIGSYASGRLYPAQRLVRLPHGLSTEDAATVLFKGITAHYLLHSTYAVGPGTVMLLYGAAGALGLGEGAFGHSGVGGQQAFADPRHDIAFAYIRRRLAVQSVAVEDIGKLIPRW